MKNILREIRVTFLVTFFVVLSVSAQDQELGKFDYRDPSKNPETQRKTRENLFDSLVEEYEVIRVEREKIHAEMENASDSEKKDLQEKLDELDSREKNVDEKLKTASP